jgi:DNA end-binding protein Ku
MATIWKGSLTFGLVNVPVELKSAVRTDKISFRQLHEADKAPIKYERVSSRTGEVVPWGEIVKGYEYAKGKFVVLSDEELKAAKLESSRTIDIVDFVQESEIDPRYFETPYFLVPTKGGEKAYALLREAIRNAGAVGIGKIIMRDTEHLAGVKVVDDALVLVIMRFASELVDPEELSFPDADMVRPQELKMAEQLVANLAEPFEPEKYTDEHRANLMKLIKAKMKGKKIELPSEVAEPADDKVIDLMARLQASLGQKGAKGAAKGEAKGGAARGAKAGDAAKPAARKRAGAPGGGAGGARPSARKGARGRKSA